MNNIKAFIYYIIPTILIIGISGIPFFMSDSFLIFTLIYFSVILGNNKKSKISLRSILIISFFAILFLIQFFIFENFSSSTFVGVLLRIFLGLCYFKILGLRFLFYWSKVNYFIIISSLIIYITINLFPEAHRVLFDLAYQNTGDWIDTKTIFIYQFSPISELYRNIGPFWEPGAYSFFLALSLYFNLFLKRDSLSSNWIIIVTLLSTVSTTGYIALALILFYYVVLRSNIKLLILPIFLFGILNFYLSSEILNDKIAIQLSELENSKVVSGESRFVSFVRDIDDIKSNFFFGTGFFLKNRFNSSPYRTNSNSNFTNMIVSLGFLGSVFYFGLLYKGLGNFLTFGLKSGVWSNHRRNLTRKDIQKLNISLFSIILLISFSEMVLSMSFTYGFLFFSKNNLIFKYD